MILLPKPAVGSPVIALPKPGAPKPVKAPVDWLTNVFPNNLPKPLGPKPTSAPSAKNVLKGLKLPLPKKDFFSSTKNEF